jgi:hypothetical protein
MNIIDWDFIWKFFQIKESDLPIKEMRHCCDDHQMCYHKCQSIKNECDNQFQRCLFKQCEKSSKDEVSLKGTNI